MPLAYSKHLESSHPARPRGGFSNSCCVNCSSRNKTCSQPSICRHVKHLLKTYCVQDPLPGTRRQRPQGLTGVLPLQELRTQQGRRPAQKLAPPASPEPRGEAAPEGARQGPSVLRSGCWPGSAGQGPWLGRGGGGGLALLAGNSAPQKGFLGAPTAVSFNWFNLKKSDEIEAAPRRRQAESSQGGKHLPWAGPQDTAGQRTAPSLVLGPGASGNSALAQPEGRGCGSTENRPPVGRGGPTPLLPAVMEGSGGPLTG